MANESGTVNGSAGSENITGVINAELISVPPGNPEIPPVLTNPDPRTGYRLGDPHNPILEGLKNHEQTGSFIGISSSENISTHELVEDNHKPRSLVDDNSTLLEGTGTEYFDVYVRQTFSIWCSYWEIGSVTYFAETTHSGLPHCHK